MVDGLAEIERIYAQSDMSNEPGRRVVEDFFKDCRELADWLDQNSGLTGALAFVHADSDLRLCDGIAQTTKHHTRNAHGAITAGISRISGGSGVRVQIHWSSAIGGSGDTDALDLARRCVAAWRS